MDNQLAWENKMLNKALSILAHPLSIGAIALYALNTFVFQYLWPSWWTGKLGDFAWLFFFPYVMTIFFALLLPRKWKERSFFLATAVVGIAFVLVKTTVFNHYIIQLLTSVLRIPVSLSKDSTDVISIIILAGTVLFWEKYQPSSATSPRPR